MFDFIETHKQAVMYAHSESYMKFDIRGPYEPDSEENEFFNKKMDEFTYAKMKEYATKICLRLNWELDNDIQI